MTATTGKKTEVVAFPQPGTTNTPYPSRKQPAFFPVSFTINDDHPLSITLQTAAIEAQNVFLISVENQLNNSLNILADKEQAILKQMSGLVIALNGLSVILTKTQALLAAKLANDVKFNDVYNGRFNDNLNYKSEIDSVKESMPPVEEQIAQSVSEGNIMVRAAAGENAVTQFIQGAVNGITSWIKSTSIYTSVKKYVDDIIDTILSLIPPSWRSSANNVKSASGDPSIGL